MGMDDREEYLTVINRDLDNLEESFDFVIILEYYAESMVLLAAHLGQG